MKPVTVITGAIAISIGSVLLTGSGHAQNKPNISKENHSDFQEKISKPPAKDCTFLRAAAVLTKRVTNLKQQDVGEINDFVLDSNNGKIRYAAVTYGGFPGFGNKMFAVPFEALTVLPNNNHEHDHRFLLKVDQEQLDGATGFDRDHWPDFTDPVYRKSLIEQFLFVKKHKDQGVKVGIDS